MTQWEKGGCKRQNEGRPGRERAEESRSDSSYGQADGHSYVIYIVRRMVERQTWRRCAVYIICSVKPHALCDTQL